MSVVNTFLSNENMKLLWDVLMDHELFQNKSKDFLLQINYLLNQNIQSFYEKEKSHTSNLMELNKKFISLLLLHIQKILQPSKNNDTETTFEMRKGTKQNLITSEEIQNHRQTQFEKELNTKQQEFTNAMTLPVPPTPSFQDKTDEPLTELELEIKRTIAQRNYDIEQIQNNIHQIKTDPTWLTAQETSIKKEKLTLPLNNKESKETKETAIKYIKIENKEIDDNILKKEIIDLNVSKKHISWKDELNEDILENNLFKKLKPLPSQENILTERMEKMETKLEKIEKMLEQILKK
jgi:hypothetical protein